MEKYLGNPKRGGRPGILYTGAGSFVDIWTGSFAFSAIPSWFKLLTCGSSPTSSKCYFEDVFCDGEKGDCGVTARFCNMKSTRKMFGAAQAASLPVDKLRLLSKILVLILFTKLAACDDQDFTHNGFHEANLSLSDRAEVFPSGLLRLTGMSERERGYAFHPSPLRLKNSWNGSAVSFTTTFVVAMVGEYPDVSGQGICFLLAPSKEFPYALLSQYMGLFNMTSRGDPSNHLVAVELDRIRNPEFADIDNNHVGIDVNDLKSLNATPASYFSDQIGGFENVSLLGGGAQFRSG